MKQITLLTVALFACSATTNNDDGYISKGDAETVTRADKECDRSEFLSDGSDGVYTQYIDDVDGECLCGHELAEITCDQHGHITELDAGYTYILQQYFCYDCCANPPPRPFYSNDINVDGRKVERFIAYIPGEDLGEGAFRCNTSEINPIRSAAFLAGCDASNGLVFYDEAPKPLVHYGNIASGDESEDYKDVAYFIFYYDCNI